jgi:hypothetical protein
MPLLGTRGSGSVKGFGFTAGAKTFEVDYLVVAGGGGGSTGYSGGGGAGGYRTSFPGGTKIKLNAGLSTPITVGAGGSGAGTPGYPGGSTAQQASPGTSSIFSTINNYISRWRIRRHM